MKRCPGCSWIWICHYFIRGVQGEAELQLQFYIPADLEDIIQWAERTEQVKISRKPTRNIFPTAQYEPMCETMTVNIVEGGTEMNEEGCMWEVWSLCLRAYEAKRPISKMEMLLCIEEIWSRETTDSTTFVPMPLISHKSALGKLRDLNVILIKEKKHWY